MKTFKEVTSIIESIIGLNKENVIGLATISLSKEGELPRPSNRMVSAYYENGCFYVSTDLRKKKMLEIEQNENVAVCSLSWFTFYGVAKNLGWVKDPSNKEIRDKFHSVFDWFKYVGDEDNPNSIVLKIELKEGIIVQNPESNASLIYSVDFENQTYEII